jgi:hypothetical protein
MAFRFVIWLRAIVSLLSVQFLLGIWVNLFGSVPSTTSVVKALEYTGDPELTAHMLLAVVVVVLGFVIAVASFGREPIPRLRSMTVGGLVSVLWSYEWGFQFILSGYSSGTDSFWMAVGFIAAMAFYGVAQTAVGPSEGERSAGPTGSKSAS